eukprot:3136011-Lingulodinium_polyedra.AAC.1
MLSARSVAVRGGPRAPWAGASRSPRALFHQHVAGRAASADMLRWPGVRPVVPASQQWRAPWRGRALGRAR